MGVCRDFAGPDLAACHAGRRHGRREALIPARLRRSSSEASCRRRGRRGNFFKIDHVRRDLGAEPRLRQTLVLSVGSSGGLPMGGIDTQWLQLSDESTGGNRRGSARPSYVAISSWKSCHQHRVNLGFRRTREEPLIRIERVVEVHPVGDEAQAILRDTSERWRR